MTSRPRLLLLGGGHAHLQVLEAFARQPIGQADVTLVSPFPTQFYSGMLPGYVGGDYTHDQAAIDLPALCSRAGARFLATAATSIHAERGTVETESGTVSFDLLSIDVGSVPLGLGLPGVRQFTIPVRPFENADRILDRIESLAARSAARVAVVGAGAGGVEIALALRRRAGTSTAIDLIDMEAPLAGWPPRGRRIISRILRQRRIRFEQGTVVEVSDRGVIFGDGRHAAADLVVWATGAAPHPLIDRSTGLAVSPNRLIQVGPQLGVVGTDNVWAAGDCADLVGHDVPRAGVFAVRQGPVVTANLRAAIEGGPGEEYQPQQRYLSILNTADGRGMARWGQMVAHGRWTWRLKDWIDRRWIERFR